MLYHAQRRLGMGRVEAMWHTPLVTLMRSRLVWLAEHGEQVDMSGKNDRFIAAYERLTRGD